MAVFVPEFEVERVRAETDFERVESYPEYPGDRAPDAILARVLLDLGIAGRRRRRPGRLSGDPRLRGAGAERGDGKPVAPLAPFIESMMVRKSEAEVALIRESARWCEHAHRLLQEYSRPGATEAEASLRAGHEATLAMLAKLGPRFGGQQGSSDGVSAGYRGQIGLRSSWAHAVAHNIEFQPGDVLVTETSAPIWGYNAELERAMIIGPPPTRCAACSTTRSPRKKSRSTRYDPASRARTSTTPCSNYFEENDLMPYWRQHVGHAIGLRNHEAPFLDAGDHTVVEPGMVFTIEPGLYSSEVGGFRHSDTVVVTPDGIDILTSYPSDIESLTIPV